MLDLTREFIKKQVSDSAIIYERGIAIYEHGAFTLHEADPENGFFSYDVDGNYGDYTTQVRLFEDRIETACDCPYPGTGCKHTVAALLDARDIVQQWKLSSRITADTVKPVQEPFLTSEEIRQQALEDRKTRARNEVFTVVEGEMIKGEHLVETAYGRQYVVTLHNPQDEKGHCTCPDYLTNRLGTCKHIIFLANHFKKKKGFEKQLAREKFPFVDIYWDSIEDQPRLFSERLQSDIKNISQKIVQYFDKDGKFTGTDLSDLMSLISSLNGNKRVRVQEAVLNRLDEFLHKVQLAELSEKVAIPSHGLKIQLYPYQVEGINFSLFKRAVLIGDEMGLGKTLQAIALAILKKKVFGFNKVLVVTLASLKEQWKREIERFSDEKAAIVAGNPQQRQLIYAEDKSFFKLTNYEAVLRDTTIISSFKPDIVILDEAQRIKNFSTKTADAVKTLPKKHSLVLTGTPLENKLEDVYSIIQFLDPHMLVPLWKFAADHFMLSRDKKGKILGYRNLEQLHEKLKSIVIRRKKEDVLSDLPDQVINNYYLDLHEKQQKMHSGYLQSLLPILNKKFLTPMDLRRIQELLLRMRMVCNSTYLIDRKTHISPKLKELEGIIEELVVQSNRKMVIFSEWTTMTFLIARYISEANIPFVELSGKVPVKKRQALIDEFTYNPDCKVFLSTDAGGTGLNLQAADCVVNFELPWNPARMYQRIGRVNRIGQKSRCVNVVNLITKNSIEEKILTGIQLKTDLFKGVFEGGTDVVEFSHEKRTEMLNRLREMMGEEPALPPREARPSEDVPEDTPHYLNPKVLKEAEEAVDFTAEEPMEQPEDNESLSSAGVAGAEAERSDGSAGMLTGQSPEKVEAVLNSGMQFLGGLMEMATGQKVAATSDDKKMIKIDRETGEVTLKFKIPGF